MHWLYCLSCWTASGPALFDAPRYTLINPLTTMRLSSNLMLTLCALILLHLIKKVIGLGLFQTGIFLFYISMGKIHGGTAPVASNEHEIYSNPIPHALILTAIVVSVSTMAVALALVVNIKQTYNTIEADEIEAEEEE